MESHCQWMTGRKLLRMRRGTETKLNWIDGREKKLRQNTIKSELIKFKKLSVRHKYQYQ